MCFNFQSQYEINSTAFFDNIDTQRPKKILIVDDESFNLKSLRIILKVILKFEDQDFIVEAKNG